MKIYVGNLSYQCSEADLEKIFGEFGEVASVKIITDPTTGRSKGFAFVEMNSGGAEAIQGLNSKEIDGRVVTVDEARPQVKRPPREGGGYGREGGGGGYGGNREGGRGRSFGGESRSPRY